MQVSTVSSQSCGFGCSSSITRDRKILWIKMCISTTALSFTFVLYRLPLSIAIAVSCRLPDIIHALHIIVVIGLTSVFPCWHRLDDSLQMSSSTFCPLCLEVHSAQILSLSDSDTLIQSSHTAFVPAPALWHSHLKASASGHPTHLSRPHLTTSAISFKPRRPFRSTLDALF